MLNIVQYLVLAIVLFFEMCMNKNVKVMHGAFHLLHS